MPCAPTPYNWDIDPIYCGDELDGEDGPENMKQGTPQAILRQALDDYLQ